MNISNINAFKARNVSFYGITKPYITKDGNKITPISINPSQAEIQTAIKTADSPTTKPMEGYNGYAYWLGQDLVVKKYKGINAINNDPYREINLLNYFYDNGLIIKNSQTGCYAIEKPSGETYMVSTKVAGENPQADGIHFTKQNLESLVSVIAQMDRGINIEGSSKFDYSPQSRFMNYDFNGKNIKITDSKAGLFDYEYGSFENIDDKISEVVLKRPSGPNCNQSDTSGLPSSMRSFEYWTLCDYLKEIDSDEARQIFNDYLEIKGNYHNSMATFFNEFEKESHFPDAVSDISEREGAHSRLLRKTSDGKIPDDILKSEARKIQMANFLHEQSPFCSTGHVNIEQLLKYTADTIEYFEQNLKKAELNNDDDRIIYYSDALELLSDWSGVSRVLDYQLSTKDSKFLNKLTNEHITTLDDVLNI